MQSISESELQREVEALRTHRRHSAHRPILDPDLPDLAASHGGGREILETESATRSQGQAEGENEGVQLFDAGSVPVARHASGKRSGSSSSRASGRLGFTARRRAGPTVPNVTPGSDDVPINMPLDPSHLFWVPASVHPEISPTDFTKFLKEHASRAVREHYGTPSTSAQAAHVPEVAAAIAPATSRAAGDAVAANLVSRSTSIARRGSTLRRQYRPENDVDDADDGTSHSSGKAVLNSRRNYATDLSIDDLQKLERLAEEASMSQDPAQLRSVLRRTMSLNTAGSTLDAVDALPSQGEDAPLIVPRPGQILRRAARTKIRKASLSGESAKTLATKRRQHGPTESIDSEAGTSNEAGQLKQVGPGEHGIEGGDVRRQSDNSLTSAGAEDDGSTSSSRQLSDEAVESIVGTYSRDSFLSESSQRTSLTSVTDESSSGISSRESGDSSAAPTVTGRRRSPSPEAPATPTQQTVSGLDGTASYFGAAKEPSDAEFEDRSVRRPVPVPFVPPVPSFEKANRAAEPDPGFGRPPPATAATQPTPAQPPQGQASSSAKTVAPPQGRGKEKKGGFASWFGLGKDDDDSSASTSSTASHKRLKKERKEYNEALVERGERESSSFLGSLFGKKKHHDDGHSHGYARQYDGQITAGSLLDRGVNGRPMINYYRYPIHVERAVYRLSHIKLANPRRPLYEQVLISNLMFWYLSIINKVQQTNQQDSVSHQAAHAQQAQMTESQRQQQPIMNRGHHSQPAASAAQVGPGSGGTAHDHPPAPAEETRHKARKGGLVRPNRAPPGTRSAEMAIPAAGYGAQHHQINNDMAMQRGDHLGSASSPYSSSPYAHHAQSRQSPATDGPALSIGQVVDPRLFSGQVMVGQPTADYAQADEASVVYDADDVVGSGPRPRTSPRHMPVVARGYGGQFEMGREVRGGRGPTRRNHSASAAKTDEHAWLGSSAGLGGSGGGGGGGGVEQKRVRSPEGFEDGALLSSEFGHLTLDHEAASATPQRTASLPSRTHGPIPREQPRRAAGNGGGGGSGSEGGLGSGGHFHDEEPERSRSLDFVANDALRALDGVRARDKRAAGPHRDPDAEDDGVPIPELLLKDEGSAAILEAARQSQSRRR